MSASQLEIKQSVENLVTECEFNWDTCPPTLSEAFEKVLGSEGVILDLQFQEITSDDLLAYIAPFLMSSVDTTTFPLLRACLPSVLPHVLGFPQLRVL